MMRSRVLALSTCVFAFCWADQVSAQCRFRGTNEKTAVTYRFRNEIPLDPLVLHVTMEFKGDTSGSQTLELPIHYAGEQSHSLSNLRALSKGVRLEPKGLDAVIVYAQPHHSIVLDYELRKDWSGPLRAPLQFHPVLLPTYFEVTGSNALVRFDLGTRGTETANFDWSGLPGSWVVATSFGAGAAKADRCQSYTGLAVDVDQGLYAAGDYRLVHFEINHQPAVLAIRGKWNFTDAEAVADLQKVVGNVREFWHDNDFPYFLVTLKPYDQDHGSSDGSAYTNAFWMYMSRLDSLTSMLPQLAHESFHAWNPLKMGPMPDSGEEESSKWFKEGGTEYYAQLLTYRAGELSAADYVKSVNRDLRAFPTSNSEYVRGRVISLWMDAAIREESGGSRSLDDVMFDMRRESSQAFSTQRILATAGRYLSAGSQKLLEGAALHHGELPAPQRLPHLSECTHVAMEEVSPFELGFDFTQSMARKTVTGVVEGGPAWVAGLRNGQALVGYSVVNGDTERPAKIKISEGGKETQISFLARGKAVRTPVYHLDAEKACRAEPVVAAKS